MSLRSIGLASALALGAALLASHSASAMPAAIAAAPAHEAAQGVAPLPVQYRGSGTIYYYYDWQPGPTYREPRRPRSDNRPLRRQGQAPAWGDHPPQYSRDQERRYYRERRDRYGYEDRRGRNSHWNYW
ncbi:MAG: hypothetical protein KF849_10625 [Rhizobiaceae bacterium]|nr:hypothetical protein [Rhizobiaceae bacterium]